VFGHTANAVVLWMAKAGWGYEATKDVLLRLGVRMKALQIGRLLKVGRQGRLPVPVLAEDVVRKLEALRGDEVAG
jgi:hypothetical protein